MNRIRSLLLVMAIIATVGCATVPPGPSVLVLPASGKSFDQFRMDDAACREWAQSQAGWYANDTVNQNIAGGAAIGTILGAGLGVIIGSTSGNAGAGAAIGAAGGMALGAAGASGPAYAAGYEVQRRYDIAYQQCMSSKGNRISGGVRETGSVYYLPSPPVYSPWSYGSPYYYRYYPPY